MSVFDELKKAGTAASSVVSGGAARASKLSQMELRKVKLRSLQKDAATAEQEMGAVAFDLLQAGELSHPMLSAAQAKISEARAAVSDLEAEIEALRESAAAADDSSEDVYEAPATETVPIAEAEAEAEAETSPDADPADA